MPINANIFIGKTDALILICSTKKIYEKNRKIINKNNLDVVRYYKPILDMKMKLFPHIMLNMIIIGTTFIIGGAVHNDIIPPSMHSLGFLAGIIHYNWLIILQHRCFIRNTELVILIYDLVDNN